MDRLSRFRRYKKTAGSEAAATVASAATAPTIEATASTETDASTAARMPDAVAGADDHGRIGSAVPSSPSSSSFRSVYRSPSRQRSQLQKSQLQHEEQHRSQQLQPQQQQQQQQQQRYTTSPPRPSSSRSSLRDFLRSSTKRSRASQTAASADLVGSLNPTAATTTAALRRSPTAALNSQLQGMSLPKLADGSMPHSASAMNATSFASNRLVRGNSDQLPQSPRRRMDPQGRPRPQMPRFLRLSSKEIYQKFQELAWLERGRLHSSQVMPNGPWARVTGEHLRTLDRYLNIQPWDNNRVRLCVPPGHIDYINASPIVLNPNSVAAPSDGAPAHHGPRPPDRYIAMQGPKQASMDHVWRMIYEQLRSPAVIVMLTETHDASIEKCYPYFPQQPDDPLLLINEHDEFGDGFHASVRCAAIEDTPYGDAIELRRLVMRVKHRKESAPAVAPESRPVAAGHDADVTMEESSSNVLKQAGPSVSNGSDGVIGTVSANGASGLNAAADTSKQVAGADQPRTEAKRGKGSSLDAADAVDAIPNGDGNGDERIVYHFLYKRWPDFGVPTLDDLDSFFGLMRLSAELNADPDNPRIVHCSAGVGRSGTFIALEHLKRELDAGALVGCNGQHRGAEEPSSDLTATSVSVGVADSNDGGDGDSEGDYEDPIFNTVNQLREQRRTMVQAEAQYMFIYHVMRKLWQDKYGVVSGGSSGEGDGRTDSGGGSSGGDYDIEGYGDYEDDENDDIDGQVFDGDDDGLEDDKDDGQPAAKRQEVDLFMDKT